jgi:bacterioferritin
MSRTNVAAPSESGFLTDIKTLRERARKHIEEGAVTEDYKADRETVLRLLNEALATELICVLRYRRHHFMAKGINAEPIAAEFLVHANEEQAHADSIATRRRRAAKLAHVSRSVRRTSIRAPRVMVSQDGVC